MQLASPISYADLANIEFPLSDQAAVVGDIIVTGISTHPRYQVIGVHDGWAWLKNIDNEAAPLGSVLLSRCHVQIAAVDAHIVLKAA
jgi:hypothetical protein